MTSMSVSLVLRLIGRGAHRKVFHLFEKLLENGPTFPDHARKRRSFNSQMTPSLLRDGSERSSTCGLWLSDNRAREAARCAGCSLASTA